LSSIAVHVAIREPKLAPLGVRVVGYPIAIVVNVITFFHSTRMDRIIRVITVATNCGSVDISRQAKALSITRYTKTVAVFVSHVDDATLHTRRIDLHIAIIVLSVAHL
jgi:hypothetical protein